MCCAPARNLGAKTHSWLGRFPAGESPWEFFSVPSWGGFNAEVFNAKAADGIRTTTSGHDGTLLIFISKKRLQMRAIIPKKSSAAMKQRCGKQRAVNVCGANNGVVENKCRHGAERRINMEMR
jgi:hypothetical protein